jgi:hypothetical protein
MYKKLLASVSPSSPASDSTPAFLDLSDPLSTSPATLDWLIHPGGASILVKIEHSLGLVSTDHTRASWEVYTRRGNTSSVSIGAVIERSRAVGKRDGCVGVSFGPGVTVEGCLLRRTGWKGRETESKRSVGMEVTIEPSSPSPAVGVKRRRSEADDKDDGDETVDVVIEKRRAMENGHAKVNGDGRLNGKTNGHTHGETVTKSNGNPTQAIADATTNEPGEYESAGVINGSVNGIISGSEGFTRKLEVEADEGTTVP